MNFTHVVELKIERMERSFHFHSGWEKKMCHTEEELIKGAEKAVLDLKAGSLSLDRFYTEVEQIRDTVPSLLTGFYFWIHKPRPEMQSFPETYHRIKSKRSNELKSYETQLRQGIELLLLYCSNKKEEHLTDGLNMLKRGLEGLKKMSRSRRGSFMHPHAGLMIKEESYAVMVEKLIKKEMTTDEYLKILNTFEAETIHNIARGSELFREAMSHMKAFKGSEIEHLEKVSELIERAAIEMAKALSNLYVENDDGG